MKRLLTAIAMVFGLAMIPGSLRADTVLGKWCDQMVPASKDFNRELALVVTDSGEVQMQEKHYDGSSRFRDLKEKGNGIYEIPENQNGEKYRIVQSTGNLQLIDNEGLIGTAKRLAIEVGTNDCLE